MRTKNGTGKRTRVVGSAWMGLCLAAVGALAKAQPADAPPTGSADEAGEELGAAIERAMAETSLDAVWQVGTPFDGVAAAWQAPNRAQELRTYFLEDGVRVVPRRRVAEDWTLGLVVSELARGSSSQVAEDPTLVVDGNRVEYERDNFVEWYVNRTAGVEQGFSLPTRPLGSAGDEPLELHFSLLGDLSVKSLAPGRVSLAAPGGKTALVLRELYAFDADGANVACKFVECEGGLALVLDDLNATYPVTIDPLIVSDDARLDAAMPPRIDQFGQSLDIEGSLAIVGAPENDGEVRGAAYIFRESGGAWTLDAKLSPYTEQIGTSFGTDVTIRGNLAAVGAPFDDSVASEGGAVYPFTYDGSQWQAESPIVGSSSVSGGHFGQALDAVTGFLFVGAPGEGGAVFGSGAVYVFKRASSPGFWSLATRLPSPTSTIGAGMGSALDANDLSLAVGAPGSGTTGGELHVYRRNIVAGTWTFEQTLTEISTEDLGAAVAVDGGVIAAGAPASDLLQGPDRGHVLFFKRGSSGAWQEFDVLFGSNDDERFGHSIAMDDSSGQLRVAIGSPFHNVGQFAAGSVSVWRLNSQASGFDFEGTLLPSSSVAAAHFGFAVGVEGSRVLVGAEVDAVGGQRSGTVRLFQKSGSTFSEIDLWNGTSQDPFDAYGASVAISGDTAVVGAPGDDENGRNTGAVFVFERSNGAWAHTARISNGKSFDEADARFGFAVATDHNYVLVTSPFRDYLGAVDVGELQVFRRNGSSWDFISAVYPSNPVAFGRFGTSLNIDSTVAVVGAPNQEVSAGFPATYVFRRNAAGIYSQEQRLTDSAGTGYGSAVAVESGRLFVGAPRHQAGVVYQYVHGATGWNYESALRPPAGTNAQFGFSLDASGSLVVVGAPIGADRSVHVYRLAPGASQPVEVFHDIDGGFGVRVATDGDLVVASDSSKAHVFQQTGKIWVRKELAPADGPFTGSQPAVAASIGTVLVGHQQSSAFAPSAGASYTFEVAPLGPIQAYGFGDGTAGPCPCGNESPFGDDEGCLNSTGAGGKLRFQGSASVSQDDLVIRAENLPPGELAILLASPRGRTNGLPFFNGLRSIGGIFKRVAWKQAQPDGTVQWTQLSSLGHWSAGQQRYFQVYYRDVGGPCGQNINATNAVSVEFAQ